MEFRRCFGFCFVNGFVAINVIEFSVWLCICSVFIQPNSIDKRKKKWIHSKILWKEILIGILFVEQMYFDIFFFFFALCARLYCCFFFAVFCMLWNLFMFVNHCQHWWKWIEMKRQICISISTIHNSNNFAFRFDWMVFLNQLVSFGWSGHVMIHS